MKGLIISIVLSLFTLSSFADCTDNYLRYYDDLNNAEFNPDTTVITNDVASKIGMGATGTGLLILVLGGAVYSYLDGAGGEHFTSSQNGRNFRGVLIGAGATAAIGALVYYLSQRKATPQEISKQEARFNLFIEDEKENIRTVLSMADSAAFVTPVKDHATGQFEFKKVLNALKPFNPEVTIDDIRAKFVEDYNDEVYCRYTNLWDPEVITRHLYDFFILN